MRDAENPTVYYIRLCLISRTFYNDNNNNNNNNSVSLHAIIYNLNYLSRIC